MSQINTKDHPAHDNTIVDGTIGAGFAVAAAAGAIGDDDVAADGCAASRVASNSLREKTLWKQLDSQPYQRTLCQMGRREPLPTFGNNSTVTISANSLPNWTKTKNNFLEHLRSGRKRVT